MSTTCKSTLIQNVRLIDPASHTDKTCDVLFSKNRILKIVKAKSIKLSKSDKDKTTIIDGSDKWLFPGLIDLGVYVREPGYSNKTRIIIETQAAVKGGVTRVCTMPESQSPIDSSATVRLIKSKAKRAQGAKASVIGALTEKLEGKKLSHMGSLKYVGCSGVSQGHEPISDLATLKKAMEYAATYELPLFLHPIEHSLSPQGGMNEGALSTRLGLPGIPVAAETIAINQIIALAKQTKAPIHFCRISTEESVSLIKQAKKDGLNITADVAAHQLFLTEVDVSEFNPLCHVIPPLRSERDKNALRQGLKEGTIDAICSDHQPHEVDAKLAPFEETSPGISGIETLLALTLKLVDEKVLTLEQAINVVSHNPANILQIKEGSLHKNSKVDCVLFDPDSLWQFDINQMISQGKNTPFNNWDFFGEVEKTFVKGKEVYSKAND